MCPLFLQIGIKWDVSPFSPRRRLKNSITYPDSPDSPRIPTNSIMSLDSRSLILTSAAEEHVRDLLKGAGALTPILISRAYRGFPARAPDWHPVINPLPKSSRSLSEGGKPSLMPGAWKKAGISCSQMSFSRIISKEDGGGVLRKSLEGITNGGKEGGRRWKKTMKKKLTRPSLK